MSSEAIDEILNRLQELENQSQFTETADNHIKHLKFLLRCVRIHVKAKTSFFQENIQNWVQDVEMRLIQPTRKGIMAVDILEDTLLSLSRNTSIQEDLWRQCSFYYQDEYGQFLAHKDVNVNELVMDWLDPLLENMKYLILLHDLKLLSVSDGKIKDLDAKLDSIRIFLRVTKELLDETSEDLLSKIKVLIENAVYLSYKLWMQGNVFSMDKFVYDFLVKINHIEPEIRMTYFKFLKASKISNSGALGIDLQALVSVDSLLRNMEELLKDPNDGLIIPLKTHQLSSLHGELSFLRYFLMDPHLKQYTEHEPNFNSLLMQLESMARGGVLLICSLFDDQKKDHIAKEVNLELSKLVEIVNPLKAKIRKMYLRVPKPSKTNFPRTPNLGFLDFLLQNLEELLKHRAGSIAYVKTEIETMLSEFTLLRSFIRNTEEDKHIARLVVDVAYEAERVVDLISASHFPNWYYMLWLYDVIQNIKHLGREFIEIHQKKPSEITIMSNMERYVLNFQEKSPSKEARGDVVPSFRDQAIRITGRIINNTKHLEVISIFGIPGGGKTTLAKLVYEHPAVTFQFHVRSWYCMSQVYRRKELLLSILRDVIEIDDKILKMNDEELDMVLYSSLKGRIYLIVIDDIWSIEPWNDLCNSFPNDNNGSRILLTTRFENVALQANHCHNVLPMNAVESWEFLQTKVCGRERFPVEFSAIGQEIVRCCRGLPIIFVLILGVLMKLDKTLNNWKQVLKLLQKQVLKDYSTACAFVIELSYDHLPDHIKPCLLYFGTFPQDSEIPTWKLIRFWIAEGFVQKKESEILETVAEGYLMELIERNLVLTSKNKSKGGVKSCQVHDLLMNSA